MTRTIPRRYRATARAQSAVLDSSLVLASIAALSLLAGLSKFGLFGMTGEIDKGSIAGQIIWGATYATAAWRLIVFREGAIALAKRSYPVVAFLVIILASSAWSVDFAITLKNAIEMIGTTLVCYYIAVRFTLREFLTILVRYFTVASIVSIVLIFAWPSHGRSSYGVVGWCGLWSEKNGFGAAMSIAILTYGVSFVLASGKRKWWLAAGFALCAFSLVGSQSVTATIVLIATVAIVTVIVTSSSPQYGMVARLVSIVGGLAALIVVLASGFDASAAFDTIGKNSTLTGRAEFWPGLLRAISDRPVLGFGYNAFFIASEPINEYIAGLTGWWIPSTAHNSFYQMVLSVGFVGITVYALAVLPAIVTSLVQIVRNHELAAAWPFAIILFSLLGSFTEVYFGIPNTIGSICFTAAMLYAFKGFSEESTGVKPFHPTELRRKFSLTKV